MNKALLLTTLLSASISANHAFAETAAVKGNTTEPTTDKETLVPDNGEIPARCYFEGGKLHFASKDEKFKLWFDNRVMIDAAYYLPSSDIEGLSSKPNKDLETDDGEFRFSNGISVRRARFGIKATLYDKWFAELDIDFAYNEVELKDVFLGYRFNDHWSVKVGQFKEPMSMERLTSSRYLNFPERPMAVDAFAAGRRLGAAFTGWGNRWWVSAGVFGRKIDLIQKEKNRGDDGWSVTGRVAVSPLNNGDMTLHIGAYGTFRKPDMSGTADRVTEFRCFPEGRVDRRRYVRAEIENVRHYGTAGVEFGFRWNKALLKGEYIYTRLARYGYDGKERANIPDCDFNGWYAAASYIILGEQRRYAPDDAEFGPMNIARKGGNLEIAARVGYLNLNDFHSPKAAVTGGSAYAYSAALNWYPVSNIALGLSYTFLNHDKYADDKGHITAGGKTLREAMPGGLDFGIIQTRFLISF